MMKARSRCSIVLFATIASVAALHTAAPTTLADSTATPIVWYKIDAKLRLDQQHRPTLVEGHQLLTWFNNSTDIITELQFHLYLNAFKNQKSTFFVESGGESRNQKFQPGEWGWIDVTSMKLEDGEDLTSKVEFIHPDDNNADDQTVIRVPLQTPVAPGAKITLDMTFTARLPRVFARSGYWGTFAMVVQWFPKIGVWEEIGERRAEKAGWNCHQYHATSEYYADFGVYDVSLTVPPSYRDKIGATGKLRSQRDNEDGSVTYNFYQEDVHDFAWTADPNYIKVTRSFKASEHVSAREIDEWSTRLSLPKEEIALKDIEVTLLIQPEHESQIDRHFTATFNGIKYFGLWYGRYPYETLTVVDPPFNARGAGGMEYPTLITAGTTWWPGKDQNPEEVIIHEFGHQYWYGLVANNEFEESWLDEGFNTYSTAKVLEMAYGANYESFRMAGVPLIYLPFELPHPIEDRLTTLHGSFNDPILRPSWKYFDRTSYGINSYPRPGLTLATLERYLGHDTMARVMRQYHSKWRYRHPTTADFIDSVHEVTGQSMSWFFDQFVMGTQTLDYEIASVDSKQIGADAGVFGTGESKSEITEEDAGQPTSFQTDVAIRRQGGAYFPVEMIFRFEDGSHITATPAGMDEVEIGYHLKDSKGNEWSETWMIHERWKTFSFITPSKMILGQVDPGDKVLLDANMTNNSWTPGTGVRSAGRWGAGSLFWFQAILQFMGGFA